MDPPYLISGDVAPGSTALVIPLLPFESKVLLSSSVCDIRVFVVTSARGSCGVDPGPVPVRLRIISFFA